MLRVLSFAALAADRSLCDSMFTDRARQFIDRLKWNLPTEQKGFETDQYDAPGTTYIVVEYDGRHAGSLRLRKPSSGIMTEDVFAGLWEQAGSTLDHALEVTRICVSPDLDAVSRTDVVSSLLLGLFDVAQRTGSASVFGVVFPSVARVIRGAGWHGDLISWHATSEETLMLMNWRVDGAVPAQIRFRARQKLLALADCKNSMDSTTCDPARPFETAGALCAEQAYAA